MAKKANGPHPIDVHVGNRIKARRNVMGLSQQDLGEALELTYQQVQKYENGMNRVVSSRLYMLSKILKVTISYFFEGFEGAKQPGFSDGGQAKFEGPDEDVMNKKETFDLVRAYYQIKDKNLRHQILEMAKAMSKS
jgi:transcriptional regulator with XRE-family HTH domain|tara:strand:+ start:250 stop:657 length:408 start_codon:yes stop_codon:yes gene_type:complete